ncbi:hypothetical protein PG997_014314 [Apiospora hydei]|uniref:Uncharacterized protein n=1 Tax=Apiospora hydei TaxID=1337664 RepID=A0ABR1UTJ2_9PEZI
MRSAIVAFFAFCASLVAAAPLDCEQGTFRCDDPMTLQDCTYMGVWETIWNCTAPAQCLDNYTCAIPGQNGQQCTPGQVECVDRWTVERCDDSGFWQFVQRCEDPEQCVVDGEGGHCGMPGRSNAS